MVRRGVVGCGTIRAALRLAQLDAVVRSPRAPTPSFEIDEADVDDVLRMVMVFLPTCETWLKARSFCVLNPRFGNASRRMGGAARGAWPDAGAGVCVSQQSHD